MQYAYTKHLEMSFRVQVQQTNYIWADEMTKCRTCGRTFGLFHKKYEFIIDGKKIVYCDKCNEQRKAEATKQLLQQLSKDDLVNSFSKKYFIYCLSLLEELTYDEHRNSYMTELNNPYLVEGVKALENLRKILEEKHGKIDNNLLNAVLKDNAKKSTTENINRLCSINDENEKMLKEIAENRIYEKFIQNYTSFIPLRAWMKILLKCMQDKGLTKSRNLEELRSEIQNYMEKEKLKTFKKNLLKPESETINIEDVDKMSGFEFEGFLSKLFRKMGYSVIQTKLSGDQGADLIIEQSKKKTVVQAKCYSGKIGNKAIQEVVASIKHYNAADGIVVTNSHFTSSAVKLADSNGVRLIDRDKLKELIEKFM
jgi:hypothetical protein